MYKIYRYSAGKLIPHFEFKEISTIEEGEKLIKWFFESKRSDHSIQFAIATTNEIVKLVRSTEL